MLARINDSITRLRQDTCKRSQMDRGKNTTKRFQHRVHLKYNKILICDDQTNNDEI